MTRKYVIYIKYVFIVQKLDKPSRLSFYLVLYKSFQYILCFK